MNLDVTCITLAKYLEQESIADLPFSSSLYTVFSSSEAILWNESSRPLYDISDFVFPFFVGQCSLQVKETQTDVSNAIKLQEKVWLSVTAYNNACFGAYKFIFRGPSPREPFVTTGMGFAMSRMTYFILRARRGAVNSHSNNEGKGRVI